MSLIATAAPPRTSSVATALPMPRPAAVMSATLPANLIAILLNSRARAARHIDQLAIHIGAVVARQESHSGGNVARIADAAGERSAGHPVDFLLLAIALHQGR